MQITKLRLSGFKSFVEPAELRIEPGLTGVVGPNGCGKSNLLEAIRWVMGENSPKSMRGGGMEDVIFAGTAQRPPRDFAEVVLHAKNADQEDLEVLRRIERGAGSAYRVNGRDVRAKDVALVFADAATGAHSPALVSQGRIAAVIAAKPAERRQMLEEAAGIAGLHVRRRDAEQKLRATEANLARLEDIMAGLDVQIAALRRQARQAERYTALSAEIQMAEVCLVYARWRDAAGAADAARKEAKAAEDAVMRAQAGTDQAQKTQQQAAEALATLRDTLADRRDDASAHGHRMAALATRLEAAEQRLADLDRQKARLATERGDADRMTHDAAEALARLERELAANEQALANDEATRPTLSAKAEDAERAARAAELAMAKATADHAGVEAEWRVAQAELAQADARLARLDTEHQRHAQALNALADAAQLDQAANDARQDLEHATTALASAQHAIETLNSRKQELGAARDDAGSALATAKAELAGIEREHGALLRDREARARQAAGRHGLTPALDRLRAAPGYERALAAVLGRDAKAPLGQPDQAAQGRFWAGAPSPLPVTDNLAAHVPECPPELTARLALVHVAPVDDGRTLGPGEWLVSMDGQLRRWDGFIARGEGAAEAARLEAENRFDELDAALPARRAAATAAAEALQAISQKLNEVQLAVVASERATAAAHDAERQALRRLDQAEAMRERHAVRVAELETARAELATRLAQAGQEKRVAQDRLAALPDPATGRATLDAARARHETARTALQAATAQQAAHDQALAVARERTATQRADIRGWQARAGDAARRLSDTARRLDEISEERAVIAAKPASLMQEIEQGESVRERLLRELAEAESAAAQAGESTRTADAALAQANETLATAREARAGAVARADNEDSRRTEMARISGERFQCPPPLLPERFGFESAHVAAAAEVSALLEKRVADRERIGPVNLVAATQLAEIEQQQGQSTQERAELSEAVHRLRGSIGNLNREGRERLRAAFEQVDTHFRHLFTRLFEGGQAHLALVDSEDPLEAGLEIYAQPPGKRLQSLTLLSGGEQALTAIALIFALFLTNPAPICVLDEVDAPLDDANIDRFCDLLDAMATETNTRYLIVTHNAVTMSRMHRLFGVTMVEQGISRLVSVDLGAAEQLLAAE